MQRQRRKKRRRSGRCDERIDLDVMRGWGQSVSLDVWHRDSRFHFHANLPCLFLNQTWPSQADDSRGLGPADAFCLKPDTHTHTHTHIHTHMHRDMLQHEACTMGKTFPSVHSKLYLQACTHAAISTHTRPTHTSLNQEKIVSPLIYCKRSDTKDWNETRSSLESQPSEQMALFFIFPLMRSHFLCSVQQFRCFFTIWVCFHKTPTESSSTKQIPNKTNHSPEVLFVFIFMQVLNLSPFPPYRHYYYNRPQVQVASTSPVCPRRV